MPPGLICCFSQASLGSLVVIFSLKCDQENLSVVDFQMENAFKLTKGVCIFGLS